MYKVKKDQFINKWSVYTSALIFFLLVLFFLNTSNKIEKYTTQSGDCYLVVDYESLSACSVVNEPIVDLVGAGWWQWNRAGSDNPKEKFDIKVVIYGGNQTKNKIEKLFPVNDKKLQDYRYIHYRNIFPYFEKLKEGYKKTLTMNNPSEECYSNNLSDDALIYCVITSCDDSWIRPSFDAEVIMASCQLN